MLDFQLDQLLQLLKELDNHKDLEAVDKKLQSIRKKIEINDENRLIDSISQALKQAGFEENLYEKLEELMPKFKSRYSKKPKNCVYIRYRNPFNSKQGWTGSGFKPLWLTDGLSKNLFTLEQCKLDTPIEKSKFEIQVQ